MAKNIKGISAILKGTDGGYSIRRVLAIVFSIVVIYLSVSTILAFIRIVNKVGSGAIDPNASAVVSAVVSGIAQVGIVIGILVGLIGALLYLSSQQVKQEIQIEAQAASDDKKLEAGVDPGPNTVVTNVKEMNVDQSPTDKSSIEQSHLDKPQPLNN